jgi:hypothetical protein
MTDFPPRLQAGDRARYIGDRRILGTIECYEYPPEGGRLFLKVDNNKPSYWFKPFQLVKVD